MDDWELLAAWQDGDEAAGEALVRRYLGLLTRFFRNKVSSVEDAADLVSETMLACTKSKEQVREGDAFRSFLFASAMNMLRRYYRKKGKRQRELDDFADVCVGDTGGPRSMSALLAHVEEGRLLVRALRRISLDYQIVLELNYIENLSGLEISELLDVAKPTVYSRLRRGKEKLREIMVELEASPEVVDSTMIGIQTWAAQIREGMSPE